jgi:hypothetical protein
MQDWGRRVWTDLEQPLPIIQAFYHNKAQGPVVSAKDNERKLSTPGISPQNLQRIIINSEYLCQELKNTSSLPSGRNAVM